MAQLRKLGKRWLSCSGAAVKDEEGSPVLAIVVARDVTQLRELEQTREDFTHTVSHDLRSPLTIVHGQAQLLLKWLQSAGLTGRERHSEEAVLKAARRMNAMIQDLVDSARFESGQLRFERRPVDLAAFVAELLKRARPGMAVGRVRTDIPADLPPVAANPDRLERVLLNLLTNALKYSPAPETVVVRAERAGAELLVSVEDWGVGIARGELPHIFNRFYQAKATQSYEGLGPGLYITRLLVAGHGGRIWAERRWGTGAPSSLLCPWWRQTLRV